MNITGGATDVTTYFVLRLAADGTEATGLTITNFDLQYVRTGATPVAKVDATALAATNSAHGDNQAIEIDATDQPGLYRVDWPDAAFAAGVKQVILTVKCATCFTEHLAVNIDSPVNTTTLAGQTVTAGAGVTFPASIASPTNITAGTITTVTNLTNAPTAGDFTATMKTSITTAATAATPNLNAAYDAAKTAATQASVDDLPTNAELTTALASSDDAVLAAIGNLNDFDPATEEVLSNIKKINDVAIVGDGSATPFNV